MSLFQFTDSKPLGYIPVLSKVFKQETHILKRVGGMKQEKNSLFF